MIELVEILENSNDQDTDIIVLGGDFNAGPGEFDHHTHGKSFLLLNR